jgi:hypothetical protein
MNKIVKVKKKANFYNSSQSEELSPSCIALSLDRCGSISWHNIWFFRLFYSFHNFLSDFQLFWPEYHWRDLSSLVHQNWCRIRFTFHTGFDDRYSYILNFGWGRIAGVTSKQRMSTPPWHLILPLHMSGFVLLDFVFAFWIVIAFDTLLTSLFCTLQNVCCFGLSRAISQLYKIISTWLHDHSILEFRKAHFKYRK